MKESDIIEGCVCGEAWAREAVYECYASAMMSVCQRYVGCRETARDLLHDGFVTVFTRIGTYAGTGSFSGWIRRIFVTTALGYLRKRDVLRSPVDIDCADCADDTQDVSLFAHLTADDLLACIASLPDGCRTVFNMHAIEGYTHVEIADALEINENTVRSRYAKARRLLQQLVMQQANVRLVAIG